MTVESVNAAIEDLERYCQEQGFKGWDPYDGLNSRVFDYLPFSRTRALKLAWIQFFKRSPFNFRKLLGVPKEYNAQGIALFISGYCNLHKIDPKPRYLEKIHWLLEILGQLESPGWSGTAWGYNFEWQARAFNQPRNSPTVVVTSFVVCGLMDAYDLVHDQILLDKSRSACEFILNDLNRTQGEGREFAFSYSPLDTTVVYNASFLASKTLARVYSYTQEEELRSAAQDSVMFCCRYQAKDGSWTYGTKKYHQWIDSFHTGYNLECLAEYIRFTGDKDLAPNLDIGLNYYLENFFTSNGTPKYYHNKMYPIDINCPAQLVVTLYRLGRLEDKSALASAVINWTLNHLKTADDYFLYQLKRGISSKIPYMRWAQSWMFYSLSFYLLWAFEREKPD